MDKLTVSVSPHIRSDRTTPRIMIDVIIALIPALIMAVYVFGIRAAIVVLTCAAACVIFEWAYQKALKKESNITDFSAVITGVLLAFNLPVTIPLWQAVFGCGVAIILIKQLFGGLGKNFANPAITARIVMFLAFSITMTTWTIPPDGVTGATPLVLMGRGALNRLPGIADMLIGIRGGSLGETSVIAITLGGAYLIFRRVISWHTPVFFIATVFVMTAVLGKDPVYHVMSGGLFLGAFFMATDYVTTPFTTKGRIIFGIGAGVLTTVFRLYGSNPEGVSYSILLMNILTPYINKLSAQKAFGRKSKS